MILFYLFYLQSLWEFSLFFLSCCHSLCVWVCVLHTLSQGSQTLGFGVSVIHLGAPRDGGSPGGG